MNAKQPKPHVAERKIFGVPVFPGSNVPTSPSAGPFTVLPPGDSQVSRIAVFSQNSTENSLAFSNDGLPQRDYSPTNLTVQPSNGLSWKLRHMDFMPNVTKSKKEDDYEKFSVLIDKANTWAQCNPQALIFSSETVTWSTIDRQIYTDSGVMLKSMNSDKKTRFVRGLRLWFLVYDEVFWDKSDFVRPQIKISFADYSFDPKTPSESATTSTLLGKINMDIGRKLSTGRILRVETLSMLSDSSGETENCSWTEQPEKSRDYVIFLRVLYAIKADHSDDYQQSNICFHDFMPSFDQRSPHSHGYETFGDLWKRASRFLNMNPALKFVNVQGVYVKIKKETDSQSAVIWERGAWCEHGSAFGNLNPSKTEYLQILRLVYQQASSDTKIAPRKMFYKQFTPIALKRAFPGLQSQANLADEGLDPVEGLFEDLRLLEDKINMWLLVSGARVANVETIVTRLATGGQEMFGPESTYLYNYRKKKKVPTATLR